MDNSTTPECTQKCIPSYPFEYMADRHRGKVAYAVPNITEQIQLEIMLFGPVEATMQVCWLILINTITINTDYWEITISRYLALSDFAEQLVLAAHFLPAHISIF